MKKIFKDLLLNFEDDLLTYCNTTIHDIILYGSTMTGDFTQSKGDIDFIVILNEKLSDQTVKSIYELHEKYRKGRGLLSQLEGVYYYFDDHISMDDGLYIGTSRTGWKRVNRMIQGPLEQGIILSCNDSLYGTFHLDQVMKINWDEIKTEIRNATYSFLKQSQEIMDLNFNIHAIQCLARNIYTMEKLEFTTKSQAIENFIKHNDFIYKKELEFIKSIRYPYDNISEAITFDSTYQVLKSMLNYVTYLDS